MATTGDPRTAKPWLKRRRPWRRRDGIFRFTINRFSRLDDLGFSEDRHVELIELVISERTMKPAHAISSELATRLFILTFPGFSVRSSLPCAVGRRSPLEPDIAVVPGNARDYHDNHPNRAAPIVEISDATPQKDRIIEVHLYAFAGLPEYRLLNLVDRQLAIHRNPGPGPAREGRFTCADVTIVPADGHAAPLAAPGARIAVADLLP